MDKTIPKNTYHYLQNHAPILFFVLNTDGKILDMNHFSTKLVGPQKSNTRFNDLIIDFSNTFDLAELIKGPVRTHILSISTVSAGPTTFHFNFFPDDERVMAYGHKDVEEMEFLRQQMVSLNQDLANTTRKLQKTNAQLKNALDHVKTLQGIIPICAHCHKIRNDQQIWDRIEVYLSENTDVKLSHGICPDCMKEHYGEYLDEDDPI